MVDIANTIDAAPNRISGVVRHSDGTPATGYKVKAFDRDLHGDHELGQTSSDATGAYDTPYSAAQLSERGKTAPDLIVKVFDAEGQLLATSPLIPGAGESTVVDLKIDRAGVAEPSEYDRMMEAIEPRLRSTSLADLTADSVAYLAAVTGQEARKIERLADSARCARTLADGDPQAPPTSVFYALLSQGLPAQANSLARTSRLHLTQALDRAVTQRVVLTPGAVEVRHFHALNAERYAAAKSTVALRSDEHSWPDAVADFLWHKRVAFELAPAPEGEPLSVADLFSPPAVGSPESLAAPPTLTADRQRVLAELLASAGELEKVESDTLAAHGFSLFEIASVRRLSALAGLAQHHKPAVQSLNAMATTPAASLPDALAYLAHLQTDDWRGLVETTGVPAAIEGETEEARKATYAAAMEQHVESACRTAVVAARIGQNRIAVPAPGRSDLITFFADNPEFEFGKHSVLAHLGNEGAARLDGVDDAMALKHNLLALERTIKLTDNYRQHNALLAGGLDSAYKMARIGQRDVLRQLGMHPDVGEQAAASIFARAGHATAVATTLLMAYRDTGVSLPVMQPGGFASQASTAGAQAALRQVPDLATLFGSLDSCACDPCLSVLSPSAYFVDIMKFLADRQVAMTVTRPANGDKPYRAAFGESVAYVPLSGTYSVRLATNHEIVVAMDGVVGGTKVEMDRGRFFGRVPVTIGKRVLRVMLRPVAGQLGASMSIERTVEVILIHMNGISIRQPLSDTGIVIPFGDSTVDVQVSGLFDLAINAPSDIVLDVDRVAVGVAQQGVSPNSFSGSVKIGEGNHRIGATLRSPPGTTGAVLSQSSVAISIDKEMVLRHPEPSTVTQLPVGSATVAIPIDGEYSLPTQADVEILVSIDGGATRQLDQDGFRFSGTVDLPAGSHLIEVIKTVEGDIVRSVERDVEVEVESVAEPSDYRLSDSALVALLARRPDLAEIELSCENSDIPIPYLDLVLEILESAAGQPFPHPIDLAASAVAEAITALNAGRVTATLSAGFKTLSPPLSTDASVDVIAVGMKWSIKDAGRRVGIFNLNNALVLAWYAPQTSADADPQGARPEHFNVSAYTALKSAVYPIGLPFDLWTEDARNHLAHLGVPQHVLMQSFYRGPGWEQAELGGPGVRHWRSAVERFGLSDLDVKLISGSQKGAGNTTGANHGPWNFWGVPAESWPAALTGHVAFLLQQSGLTFDELQQLLDMRFVNTRADGKPVLRIQLDIDETHQTVSCDLSNAQLIRTGPAFPGDEAGVLWRMHRFVRLWRKVGWPMADVDRALRLSLAASDPSSRYAVFGAVTDPQGLPVAGLTLEAIDQDIFSESVFGSVTIDARGRYRIEFPASAFRKSDQEVAGPDLVLRVLDTQGQTIGRSKRHRDATRSIELNLRVDVAARTVFEQRPDTVPPTAGEELLSAIDWTRTYLTERLQMPELFQDTGMLGTTRYTDFHAPGRPGAESPYERVYLRKSLSAPPIVFELRSDGWEIRGAGKSGAPFVSHIASACGLPIVDAQRLLDDGDGLLSLRALTRLYFSARAARAAGLSIWEFVELRKLGTGIVPFQGLASAESVASDAAMALAGIGMPAAQAIWLLTHGAEREESGNERQRITALLTDIRSALAKIAVENTLVPDATDPEGQLVRLALQQLTWDPGVIEESMEVLSRPVVIDVSGKDVLSRHLCTFSVVDHSAALSESVAATLDIPLGLDQRCYYDQAAHRLHFIGSMTAAEHDVLAALSTDASYTQALATLRDVRAGRPTSAEVFVDDAALARLAAMADAATRFALMLPLLAAHRRRSASSAAITARLSSAFAFEVGVARRLIEEWVSSAQPGRAPRIKAIEDFLDPAFIGSPTELAVSEDQFPLAYRTCVRLAKVRALVQGLSMPDTALAWLFPVDNTQGLGWLDPGTLPAGTGEANASLAGLLRLVNLAQLSRCIPGGERTLDAIYALAREPYTSGDTLIGKVAGLTGWSRVDLQALLGGQGFNLDTDEAIRQAFAGEWLLLRLVECFGVMKRLGATATQCLRWANHAIGPDEASEIQRLVRARHSDTSWADSAKPLHDALRDKRRQALVSHLVARQGLRDSKDLYSRYLIDVEMSPCAMTSRIKQACASVQLFVQRCLLNLEPDVTPSVIDTQLWSWMKNYRVWEANRRIFLYPENWLDPELRDDKTPGFREFESALLQDDVDTRHADLALKGFVDSVNDVAQLEIRAMCLQRDTHGDIVHLFGRTRGTPHQHFHRRRDQGSGIWSEWKKIGLNIDSDFMLPIWQGERLFLYWPSFVSETDQPTAENEKPKRRQNVSLCSSVFSDDHWGPKSVSSSKLITSSGVYASAPWSFLFDGTLARSPTRDILGVEISVKTKPFFDGFLETRYEGKFFAEIESGEISVFNLSTGGTYENNGDRDRELILFRDLSYWQHSDETVINLAGQGPEEILGSNALRLRDATSVPQIILANTEPSFKLVVDWQQRFVSGDAPMLFHDSGATFLVSPFLTSELGRLTKFEPSCHTSLPEIRATLRANGLTEFYSIANQARGLWKDRFETYSPQNGAFMDPRTPLVDFCRIGSYATCNWEMFFHAPLYVASSLSRNQRFEDAKRWFEYIFDPTSDSADPSPNRFWRFLPFHCAGQPPTISDLLEQLSNNDPELIGAVADWRAHPFEPHRVARLRPSAYQWSAVMKYLDNLITWADQLFRRDTIESINEATQLYMLAAEILGPRPRCIDTGSSGRTARTFNHLGDDLDAFSNALVQLESLIPSGRVVLNARPEAVLPPLHALYFCVPPNDVLLGYWDTVDDRLFKIRHCMNLQGVVRQLPLYEPPLDPGLLARARAAGVDLASALQDQASPLPLYRFGVMVQKALELCNEVKGLGGVLLSTMEKRDAEQLSLLRTTQETALLHMVEAVRQGQIDEATAQRSALQTSRESACAKFLHYEKLLGTASPTIPKVGDIIAMAQEPAGARIESASGAKVVRAEIEEAANLALSHDQQQAAGLAEMLANYLRLIPELTAGIPGNGSTFGGANLGTAASMYASVFKTAAEQFSYQATRAGKQAGFVLRENEWVMQRNLAALEIMQIDKQAIASDIRIDIATKEMANHRKQIDNSQAIDTFLREKYTSQDMYASMAGQVSSVYFQCYQLAYDLAKRAERTFQRELGLESSNFIQFGYWDSLKKGLLAGEQMSMDIRRMEASYHDRNKREFEITKHISLRRLAPGQLIALRTTGTCEFDVPEWLFDLDGPGHFMRRLKAVSLSVPCVTGPYTGVHCKLTLLSSHVRARSVPAEPYQRKPAGDDPRFTDYLGAVESMVTSSASNDSGLFETNLRDERYLPFEGSGVIARWRIELPMPSLAQFDYTTMSDVILHLRYTARDGGEELRKWAEASAQTAIVSPGALLVVVKQDFPSEWARAAASPSTAPLKLTLSRDLLPYVLAATTKRQSIQLFDATPDPATNTPVGFGPLADDVGPTDLETTIDLGTLNEIDIATGGVGPLLLVELGSP